MHSNAGKVPTDGRDRGDTAPFPPRARDRPAAASLLRLGVVVGERLLEEKVVRGEVTLGQAASNTLIVPWETLPARWRLFERDAAGYRLRLAPAMEGRIARGGEVMTSAALARGVRTFALPQGSRGRIAAGEVTILFQIVPPSPRRPAPRLPSSLRGGSLAELDAVFSVLAALSLVLHLAMVFYLRGVDWPRRPDVAEVPPHVVRFLARPSAPPPPAVPDPTASSTSSQEARTAAPATTPARRRVASRDTLSPEERRRAFERQAARIGLLQLLSSRGAEGAVRDLLTKGSVDREQEEALRDVGGLRVAGEAMPAPLVRSTGAGSDGPKIADHTGLRGSAGIAVADVTGPGRAERRVPMVKVDPPEVAGDDVSNIDAQLLARVIRAHLAEVRACYERALKRHPDVGGKLVLRLTLTMAGTVSAVEIDDDSVGDAQVVACVRAAVARWRFPALPRGGLEVSFPFVFQPAR